MDYINGNASPDYNEQKTLKLLVSEVRKRGGLAPGESGRYIDRIETLFSLARSPERERRIGNLRRELMGK